MHLLEERDLRAASVFTASLYAAPDLAAFGERLLKGLPKLVGVDRISYNFINVALDRLDAVSDPPDLFPGALDVINSYFHQHPVARHIKDTAETRWIRISDVASQRAWRRTDLYNAYYRRMGIDHQISTMFRGPRKGYFAVALNRGKWDFADRDKVILDLTVPHLIQSYVAVGRMTQLAGELAILRGGLDVAGIGLVVLDAEGRIGAATSQAREWLAEYFSRDGRSSSRLPGPVLSWVRRQLTDTADPRGAPSVRRPLIAHRGAKDLLVRCCGGPGNAVLILSQAYTSVPAVALEPLGLSRREADVLKWVAEGKRNAEIAVILGISTSTVNHHLERIHQKLGVESRTAAAACALAVLHGSRPPL